MQHAPQNSVHQRPQCCGDGRSDLLMNSVCSAFCVCHSPRLSKTNLIRYASSSSYPTLARTNVTTKRTTDTRGLSQIKDPDLHKDIVTLGFIKDLKIDGGN